MQKIIKSFEVFINESYNNNKLDDEDQDYLKSRGYELIDDNEQIYKKK